MGVHSRLPSSVGLQTQPSTGNTASSSMHTAGRGSGTVLLSTAFALADHPPHHNHHPPHNQCQCSPSARGSMQLSTTPEKLPDFSQTESSFQKMMLRSHLALETSYQLAPESQCLLLQPAPCGDAQDIPLTTAAPQKVTQKPTPALPAPKGRQNHPGDNPLQERSEHTTKELHKPHSHTSGARQQEFIFSRS